ncbi:MAG: SH3 domain-containing protein [Alphaproteobacteria bacterium]|nr:SH3 domain-containing protein [Alphaproteobacteria bacterium]
MRKILYIFMFCLLVTYMCLPSEQTAVYSVNVSALNLRVCPKTNCQIVAKLIAGETVTILEDCNRWVKIKTDKGRGYVAKAYLTLQKQSDSSKNHSSTWGWLLAILMLLFLVYKENPKATDQLKRANPKIKNQLCTMC